MKGWMYLVAGLALVFYLGTLMYAGHQRRRTGVRAPAVTGAPAFERALRVQQNTLENLVPFLAALFLAGQLVNPLWAAALGAVWLAGRALYWVSYVRDPDSRGPGFILAFAALVALIVIALWGAVRVILAHA